MSFPGSVLLSDKDILTQTTTQRLPLGTRGYTADGRSFRYSKAAAVAIAVGKLCQQAAPDESLDADQNLCTSTLYACADYQDTNASAIYIKPAATEVVAANIYKEGYLYINNELGEGQLLRVASHDAVDGTVSVVWKMNLEKDSKLSATISTASLVGLIQNKYDAVIIRPDTARTGVPLGVTPRAISASNYFWLQTWGPCACVVILAAGIGLPLSDDSMTGTGTAGALHKFATSTLAYTTGVENLFGRHLANVMAPAATTEHCLIDLQLAP